MLVLNKQMRFIRCSKYEYIVKKGSISNYSFSLKDDDKSGLLDFLFERANYPASLSELVNSAVGVLPKCGEVDARSTIEKLTELEVLESMDTMVGKPKVFVVTGNQYSKIVYDRFSAHGYPLEVRIVDSEPGKKARFDSVDQEYAALLEAVDDQDCVIVIKTGFSPSLFYEVNKLCTEDDKKLVIAYLDGAEGVIVPLLNASQVGCYNDFELLRESSFFNLLDYQIMKEDLVRKDSNKIITSQLYFSMLIDHTLLLFDRYIKSTSINYYAYSLDFERLVFTKTRLLKFPKCPSCQGDRNLVHPFI